MYALLFLAITSFLLALVLTPCVRHLFHRLERVDLPEAREHFHDNPIPRAGGIAIALSFALSAGLLQLLQPSSFITKLAPSAALVFLIGLLDDLFRLKPWQKLAGQIAAASIAYIAGVRVLAIGGGDFPAPWAWGVTVFWLVACSNAINLIDGVDGLAAGVSLVAAAAMLFASVMQHDQPLALAIVPLAGCLLGFIRYNLHPASIFLGDCGSLSIGFLLGCYGVLWSHGSTSMLGMAAPLVALSLPLLDTGLAIIRRFLRHQPIFRGDHSHIHHRLLEHGFRPGQVVFILCCVCAVAAFFSLCMASARLEVPVILLFALGAGLGIHHLGYIEFDTLARMLVQGSFFKLLRSRIAERELEGKLAAAQTADEFWKTLRNSYREFGLDQIHMRLADQTFRADTVETILPEGAWRISMPFAGGDFVQMTRQGQMDKNDRAAALSFADIIQRTLEARHPFLVTNCGAIGVMPRSGE